MLSAEGAGGGGIILSEDVDLAGDSSDRSDKRFFLMSSMSPCSKSSPDSASINTSPSSDNAISVASDCQDMLIQAYLGTKISYTNLVLGSSVGMGVYNLIFILDDQNSINSIHHQISNELNINNNNNDCKTTENDKKKVMY